MAEKPSEILVFDFLAEEIAAAAVDSVLYSLELHDTIFQKIKSNRGVRISDCVSQFSPYGTDEKEYDALITLACFVRVEGKQKTSRQPALSDVFEIQKAIYALFRAKADLNNRVCDSLLQRGGRGYDSLDGEPFAVANIPLIINPTGASYTNS